MTLFRNRYRVVRDGYLGYEVQCLRWWFPIWLQVYGINTVSSIREAIDLAKTHKRGGIEIDV